MASATSGEIDVSENRNADDREDVKFSIRRPGRDIAVLKADGKGYIYVRDYPVRVPRLVLTLLALAVMRSRHDR